MPAGLLRRMFKKVNERELVAIASHVVAAPQS